MPERHRLSRRGLLQIGTAGAICAAARAQDTRRMPPMDQSGRDPGLADLIRRMRGCTSERNSRGLEAMMRPDFRVEFDGGLGPRAFRSFYGSESTSSPIWSILERLLALGGTFYSEDLFAIPYVYTQFPSDLALLEHVVALGEQTPVLEAAEAGARQIGTLDYAITALAEPLKPPVLSSPGSFLRIRFGDAETGYVAARDVYSPAAHRAFFEKRNRKWRWISLAAATMADPPDLERKERGRRR